MSLVLHTGNCLEILPGLPEQSVHCVVTSPPYFGLRDYAVFGQLGLEKTPEEYISNLVNIFREIWWVLRDDGTVWLNLGDSYATQSPIRIQNQIGYGSRPTNHPFTPKPSELGLKSKDLMGIPWRVAFALQADGWHLRSDIIEEVELYCPCGCGYVLEERIWRHAPDREIIWAKKNPMPESVTDRPTKSHEYIFLLTKSKKYFYDSDSILEPFADKRMGNPGTYKSSLATAGEITMGLHGKGVTGSGWNHDGTSKGRNKRSVWSVATQGFPGAHFATFPQELIKPCILAGTSEAGCCRVCGTPWVRVVERTPMVIARSGRGEALGEYGKTAASGTMVSPATSVTLGFRPACLCYNPGDPVPCTVLDPFNGAGTTGVVCKAHNRNYIGIDLKPGYIKMSQDRIEKAPDYKDSHAAFMANLEKTLALLRSRRVPKPLK